jgi:hypothetical protein
MEYITYRRAQIWYSTRSFWNVHSKWHQYYILLYFDCFVCLQYDGPTGDYVLCRREEDHQRAIKIGGVLFPI